MDDAELHLLDQASLKSAYNHFRTQRGVCLAPDAEGTAKQHSGLVASAGYPHYIESAS